MQNTDTEKRSESKIQSKCINENWLNPLRFYFFSFDWLVLSKIRKTRPIASKEGEPGFLTDNEETVVTVGNDPAFKYLLIIHYSKKGSCCQACFENWLNLCYL